jgi:hypothetical protein
MYGFNKDDQLERLLLNNQERLEGSLVCLSNQVLFYSSAPNGEVKMLSLLSSSVAIEQK